MNIRQLRAAVLRLRGVLWSGRLERDLAEEIESHLQLHVEDNLRAGMTPEEARRQALLALGGVEATKERLRDRGGLPVIDTLAQDVCLAVRSLRRASARPAGSAVLEAAFDLDHLDVPQPAGDDFYRRLLDGVRAHPGVAAAAITNGLTLSRFGEGSRQISFRLWPADDAPADGSSRRRSMWRATSSTCSVSISCRAVPTTPCRASS